MSRLPHIPIRDSGGSFSLNNADDGTPIREMFSLDEGLLIITDKCTYRVQVADQIDPHRTNPNLPHNVHQKLFDHGVESELLCRTLLQSKVLFRKEFQTIDIEHGKRLAFDALSDFVAMQDAAFAFRSAEQKEIEKKQNLERKDASIAMPAVGNVRGHCKTYVQKADHVAVSLLGIVRLFYPEMKGGNWDQFLQMVKAKYGPDNPFSKVAELAVPFLKLIRNTRDCLDHANVSGVTTKDFELQPDGKIALPSIEVNFRGTVEPRRAISSFMLESVESLLTCFEMIIVHTCAHNTQPFAGMPMVVNVLPDNYRQAWRVRFAYGSFYQDGNFVPCG